MTNDYKHNHYVPEWYQKRFMKDGNSKYHYLDLQPETITNQGHTFSRKDLRFLGAKNCFAKDDLYTTNFWGIPNRDIEKFFFGNIDLRGKMAVEHFGAFKYGDQSHEAFQALLPFMSVQKLRTIKGLSWLKSIFQKSSSSEILIQLQKLQNLFCATWTECVWQIADASNSPTKFIISDHPVVVYNRHCFPGSKYCKDYNDPDIRYAATHTYFPLSLDKILILTNLSWVRDPFQPPYKFRPNPALMRETIFNFTRIQIDRFLTEEEVLEINYITKLRAYRFIAASEKDWLYPEDKLQYTNWKKLGDGYLLMPDPRHIHGGGEIVIGYKGGRSDAYSAYGHKPWQNDYKNDRRERRELASMEKFKAEWSATFGPVYRGIPLHNSFTNSGNKTKMSDDYWQHECERDRRYLAQKGEKRRRRNLKRQVSKNEI